MAPTPMPPPTPTLAPTQTVFLAELRFSVESEGRRLQASACGDFESLGADSVYATVIAEFLSEFLREGADMNVDISCEEDDGGARFIVGRVKALASDVVGLAFGDAEEMAEVAAEMQRTISENREEFDQRVVEVRSEETETNYEEPTPAPSAKPTPAPSAKPTPAPSAEPTPAPSAEPSAQPSGSPRPSAKPSAAPTPATKRCSKLKRIGECDASAKCEWIAGSHKCLEVCSRYDGNSKKCSKKKHCRYKTEGKKQGACKTKRGCEYQKTKRKCKKDAKCRVKKKQGAKKFDGEGQKKRLCVDRRKKKKRQNKRALLRGANARARAPAYHE